MQRWHFTRQCIARWIRSIPFILVLSVGGAGVAACIAVTTAVAGGEDPGHRTKSSFGLTGPIAARVLRVIDGDTIYVRAKVWLGQHIEVSVRLAGIDAPELRSRCRKTRALAYRARNHLHHMIAGTTVFLHDIRRGKYAGRVVAVVRQRDGAVLSRIMLDDGLAVPSTRRRARQHERYNDCNPPSAAASPAERQITASRRNATAY